MCPHPGASAEQVKDKQLLLPHLGAQAAEEGLLGRAEPRSGNQPGADPLPHCLTTSACTDPVSVDGRIPKEIAPFATQPGVPHALYRPGGLITEKGK